MPTIQSDPGSHDPISADSLFQLAFSMPREQFQRLILLGWRPVTHLPAGRRKKYQQVIQKAKDAATKLPAEVLVFEDQGNLVIEFAIEPVLKAELCLTLTGNILTIDRCPLPRTNQDATGIRRRAVILPPEVTADKIKARIVENHLRIEVRRTCH